MWNPFKSWFGSSDPGKSPPLPELQWIAAEDNPWGVPVLDVRPVTLGMLSTSRDRACAENALSFGRDDGTGFIGIAPPSSKRVALGLRYRIDRMLADGALFLPREMEHKWAIYCHQRKLIFIRSWKRAVVAVADFDVTDDWLTIETLHGDLTGEDDEQSAAYARHLIDYLIRTHCIEMPYPAPLPQRLAETSDAAAMWCMSLFGNMAVVATPYSLPIEPPSQPLRSNSLLHIAVARNDEEGVRAQLALGVPIDLLAQDGLAPLHWSLATEDTLMLDFLVQAGSPVDVRSAEGATPLMNAVQSRNLQQVSYLVEKKAAVDARDQRGFTALHRAAEMGSIDIVRLLLSRGANPTVESEGQTPSTLAEKRGEHEIVSILARA
jgi:hypothetical protein